MRKLWILLSLLCLFVVGCSKQSYLQENIDCQNKFLEVYKEINWTESSVNVFYSPKIDSCIWVYYSFTFTKEYGYYDYIIEDLIGVDKAMFSSSRSSWSNYYCNFSSEFTNKHKYKEDCFASKAENEWKKEINYLKWK